MNQTPIAITFIAFLLLFILVGIYSATRASNTTTDYLLASRNVNPWLIGLSAMATQNSGLVFTGEVAFAYNMGISAIWLGLGWAVGTYIAWWFIFKPLREISEAASCESFSSFLAHKIEGERWISAISGLIIIVFLGSYAAAQLVAGSKALNAVFGWNYNLGAIAGAAIVLIYCFSGGIRASIWTDAVQGIIMIGSLLLLLAVGAIASGGIGELWGNLEAIDPALVNLTPPNLQFGLLPFIIGWIAVGFGVVGQPHIVVRGMAIDSPQRMGLAREINFIGTVLVSSCALGIGPRARVLLPELMVSGDPELALPYLSLELLPVVLVGLMLAGLFAATISTADSQILSCSCALTQDIFPQLAKSYQFAKLATVGVTAIILGIALTANDSVFTLVLFSWSALASALGPLALVRASGKSVSMPVAIAMMLVGMAAAFTWIGLKLSGVVNEALPGMAASVAVYLIHRLFSSAREGK